MKNPLVLRLADDAAHGGVGIGRQTGFERRAARRDFLQHRVVDGVMHEGPAGRTARLAAPAEVHSSNNGGCNFIWIRIGKSD